MIPNPFQSDKKYPLDLRPAPHRRPSAAKSNNSRGGLLVCPVAVLVAFPIAIAIPQSRRQTPRHGQARSVNESGMVYSDDADPVPEAPHMNQPPPLAIPRSIRDDIPAEDLFRWIQAHPHATRSQLAKHIQARFHVAPSTSYKWLRRLERHPPALPHDAQHPPPP